MAIQLMKRNIHQEIKKYIYKYIKKNRILTVLKIKKKKKKNKNKNESKKEKIK